MVFKLVVAAAKTWRKLKGENLLPKVVQVPNSGTASKSSTLRRPRRLIEPRHPISIIAGHLRRMSCCGR